LAMVIPLGNTPGPPVLVGEYHARLFERPDDGQRICS
jgi:hypothetical protein